MTERNAPIDYIYNYMELGFSARVVSKNVYIVKALYTDQLGVFMITYQTCISL